MGQQQTQVQVTKFSKLPKLEGLHVIQGTIPEPREGEVLCRIVLRPVNPTDVHAIQGLRPIGPHHTPHIAGGEGEHFSMQLTLILCIRPALIYLCAVWFACCDVDLLQVLPRWSSSARE